MTEENKQLVLKLYSEGYNDCQISRMLGISNSAIQAYRNKLHLPKVKRTVVDDRLLIELYNQGKSDEEIAKVFNISPKTVSRHRCRLRLVDNSKISKDYQYTEEQFQVILGSILGDGNLLKKYKKGGTILTIAHCDAQLEYLKYKQKLLQPCISNIKRYIRCDHRRKVPKYHHNEIYTPSLLSLNVMYRNWYIPIKRIYKEDLYKIKPLGLAIWFMDDGYKIGNAGELCTNCFPIEDLQIIQQMFKDLYDIQVTIYTKRHLIYIPSKEFKKFVKLIQPYIIPSMQYKISIKSHSKTPLNGETPVIIPEVIQDNPVLNLPEMADNAQRLQVMPTDTAEAIKSYQESGALFKVESEKIQNELKRQSKLYGNIQNDKSCNYLIINNLAKDSGNTVNDCNQMLAVFDPFKEGLKTYRGYDIEELGERFRVIMVLKNRFGESNVEVGVNFFGEINYFMELPTPDKISDYSKYQQPDYITQLLNTTLHIPV